jgi:hypothetical protein
VSKNKVPRADAGQGRRTNTPRLLEINAPSQVPMRRGARHLGARCLSQCQPRCPRGARPPARSRRRALAGAPQGWPARVWLGRLRSRLHHRRRRDAARAVRDAQGDAGSLLKRAAPCVSTSISRPSVRPCSHNACKMGLEGIVSKRKDSTYRSGRSPHWGREAPVFAQSTFPGPSVSPAVFQNCSGWDFSYVGNPTDIVPACA